MDSGFDIVIENGVTRVNYRGRTHSELSQAMMREAFGQARAHGSHWILIDIRAVHDPDYHVNAIVRAESAPPPGDDMYRGMRVAILGSPGDERLPYVENVLANRGLPGRAFDDEAHALAWLMSAL